MEDWVRVAMDGGMRDGRVLSQLDFPIAVKRQHGHNNSSFSEIFKKLFMYVGAFPCMHVFASLVCNAYRGIRR